MNLKKLVTIILCAIVLNLSQVHGDSVNDDLEDFDFEDLSPSFSSSSSDNNKYELKHNEYHATKDIRLDDIFDSEEDDYSDNTLSNSLDLKQKAIRTALSIAMSNKVLRQKFVEVMPILRVLSSQQRLALSALISVQINAKPGTELKLNQVKSMFGDSKKLIIPLVFDIANLVKTAAKSSLNFLNDYYASSPQRKPFASTAVRRNFELSPLEIEAENEFYASSPNEKIDPMAINNQLYRLKNGRRLKNLTESESQNKRSRSKRSNNMCNGYPCLFNSNPNESKKNFQQEQQQQQQPISAVIENRSFHDRKLNTSNFISSYNSLGSDKDDKAKHEGVFNKSDIYKNMSYEEIENLSFHNINGSFNNGNLNITVTEEELEPEELPTPESLVRTRQRNGGGGNKHGPVRKPPTLHRYRPKDPPTKNCEKFTPSMCLKADDYPMELILGSIRRNKNAMPALLAEYRDKATELDHEDYLEELESSKKRREDSENDIAPGGMCQSIVKYARPQKARSAAGEWKFIVNTGQHTQTLRLEKCSHPQTSCAYLSENFRSRCIQVYNFHRLLSWDKARGLHVDIYKVPTCCSCHLDGYREAFPPQHTDYSIFKNIANQGFQPSSPIQQQDEDYFDDEFSEGDDSIAYQFANGFKKVKPNKYDQRELLSSGTATGTFKNRYQGTMKKVKQTTPATAFPGLGVGGGLSHSIGSSISVGGGGGYDSFKRGPNLSPSVGNYLNRFQHPLLLQQDSSYETDDRSDQESSGSELGKEVTVYPPIDKTTNRPKRKRISSVSTAKPPKSFGTTISKSNFPQSSFNHTKINNNAAIGTKNFRSPPKISSTKTDLMNKRINYNYHPIIDFFDEHSDLLTPPGKLGQKRKRIGSSATPGLTSSTKDRRQGFGSSATEENWRPIIIE